MEEKTEIRALTAFAFAYALIFLIHSYYIKNYEFFFYALIAPFLVLFARIYHKVLHLKAHIIAILVIVGLFHFIGSLYLGPTRIYDYNFTKFLGYDSVIHFFGIFSVTLIAYNFLKPHLDHSIEHKPIQFPLLITLIALGIGAMVEIVEFAGVATLNIVKVLIGTGGVGDYYNTIRDLIYDLLGAIIPAFIISDYHKGELEKFKKRLEK